MNTELIKLSKLSKQQSGNFEKIRKYYRKIKNIINEGADPNYQDAHGKTALMYIMETELTDAADLEDILIFFLEQDIDIDIQDEDGKTILMYAITEYDEESVDRLIHYEADLDIKDKNGKDALMYADALRYPNIKAKINNAIKKRWKDFINLPIDEKKNVLSMNIENNKTDKELVYETEEEILNAIYRCYLPAYKRRQNIDTFRKHINNFLEKLRGSISIQKLNAFIKYINNTYSNAINTLDEELEYNKNQLKYNYFNTGDRQGRWSILHNKDTDCEEECPICFENFTPSDIREKNIVKHTGGCNKCIHKECLLDGYKIESNANRLLCPLCRQHFGKVKRKSRIVSRKSRKPSKRSRKSRKPSKRSKKSRKLSKH